MPPAAAARAPVKVFLSYSHRDEKSLAELKDNLAVLARRRMISIWYDRRLDGGDDLDQIWPHFDAADLIVLLVSQYFLRSPACNEEMVRAFARHRAGETSVVPVILRPCLWQDAVIAGGGSEEEIELLRQKIALPRDGKPISKWNPRQDGYFDVVSGLKAKIAKLAQRPRPQERPTTERFYNLPIPPTPFIGRERERADLEALLVSEEVRLIVLSGPGGVGKTRLALRVASDPGLTKRFPHGVCLVRLEQVAQPSAVIPTIAKTLEIKESDDSRVEAALARYLAGRQMLLLLDSFERVARAAGDIARLLAESPGLKVLITSRSDHRIVGRHKFPVPLLPVPELDVRSVESLVPYDAVTLFSQTAKRETPDFTVNDMNAPAVVQILSHLEGLALSIELVAARVGEYPPNLNKLLQEVTTSLSKVAQNEEPGRPKRHRSIEATITYSYELLNEEEKELFQQLAVFSGGCHAKDVAAVWGLRDLDSLEKGLSSLVAKSLLRQQQDEVEQEFRFKMLDVIREYALDRLKETGSLKQGERRYAEIFTTLAEQAEPRLTSAGRGDWLQRLDAEHANFQAALAWCQSRGGDREIGLRLGGALFWFWNLRGHFRVGRDALKELLKAGGAPAGVRAKGLYAAGGLAFLQGDFGEARPALEESVRLWREVGDRRLLAYALVVLGMTLMSENQLEAARRCEEESLEIFGEVQASGEIIDSWGYALALNDLGNVFRAENRHVEALELYRRSLRRWRRMKDPWGIPLTLSNIGFLEMIAGNRTEAREAFESALKFQRKEKDRWGMGETLKYLADLAVRDDQDGEAERLYHESLALNREIGRTPFMVGCLAGLAVLAARSGRDEYAAYLAGAVERHHQGAFRASAKSIDHGMYDPAMQQVGARFARFEAVRAQARETELAEIVNSAVQRDAG